MVLVCQRCFSHLSWVFSLAFSIFSTSFSHLAWSFSCWAMAGVPVKFADRRQGFASELCSEEFFLVIDAFVGMGVGNAVFHHAAFGQFVVAVKAPLAGVHEGIDPDGAGRDVGGAV